MPADPWDRVLVGLMWLVVVVALNAVFWVTFIRWAAS
jgi:hypothetical protein